MTKADIVRQVSENTGIDKKEVGAVIESFMENVRESFMKALFQEPIRLNIRLVETLSRKI